MKKLLAGIMSLAVLIMAVPVSVSADSEDETQVINKHGAATYIGPYSAWNESSWDSDEFTEVTGEDVNCSDNLMIKGGKIGSVTVNSDCSLTIYDGTMSDVDCEGNIIMTGGTTGSLNSDEDISISGGTVKGNIESEGSVTMSGKLTVSGGVTAVNITAYAMSGSDSTAVYGDITFSGTMALQGTNYKFGKINGENSGTLEFKNYNGTLPATADLAGVSVCQNSVVTTSGAMEINTLTIEENATFSTTSTLTAGTINGPGTLSVNAGCLTLNSFTSEYPVFDFNGTEKDGAIAFKAKSGVMSGGNVTVFGYGLTKQETTSGYDNFILRELSGNGVTLNTSSISVSSIQYATVKATVTPSLSSFPNGTKLYWKLIDTSSKFSISQNTDDNSCRVFLSSSAGSNSYSARLAAYLMDNSGSILADYKSDSCLVTSASGSSVGSGLKLDTSSVSIKAGGTYWVLAITNSTTPPVQKSYNSAVATVGKAKAYNSNGKVGWLYPVKAVAKGGVTIDIGGQKMITTVAA